MKNENLKYKLSRTQREESYLWKTTHLNTAEEINKGGMKGKRGRRDRRGKRRKTEAEHEKKSHRCFCHQQDQMYQHLAAFHKETFQFYLTCHVIQNN